MNDNLFRFRNSHKVNEACNGSLLSRLIQEHGMKIIYPLHVTGFDTLLDDDKKESETLERDMFCAILYLDNSVKTRFFDINKCVKNDYVLNKAKYPRTFTTAQRLLLKYQTVLTRIDNPNLKVSSTY